MEKNTSAAKALQISSARRKLYGRLKTQEPACLLNKTKTNIKQDLRFTFATRDVSFRLISEPLFRPHPTHRCVHLHALMLSLDAYAMIRRMR